MRKNSEFGRRLALIYILCYGIWAMGEVQMSPGTMSTDGAT